MMANSKDYISKIEAMGREDLIKLWNTRGKSEVKSFWEPGKILEYTLLRGF